MACREAGQLAHPEVGTEHLLLALLAVDRDPLRAAWLEAHLRPEQVRTELRPAGLPLPPGLLPLTPRLRAVVDRGVRVASSAEPGSVGSGQGAGPPHLLVGLLDDGAGLGVQLLRWFGVDLVWLRGFVLGS